MYIIKNFLLKDDGEKAIVYIDSKEKMNNEKKARKKVSIGINKDFKIVNTMFNKIKAFKPIVYAVVLCVLVSTIGIFSYNYILLPYHYDVKTVIFFNYSGIEEGLDPFGRKFDVSMIKSQEILEKVSSNLNLLENYNITCDDLKENIQVKGIVPNNIVERITEFNIEGKEVNKVEDVKDRIYFPVQFEVLFNVDKSFNISKNSAVEILDNIISEYISYFKEYYSDAGVLRNAIGDLNYYEYDYPEVPRVINNHINIIHNYISSKMMEEEGKEFRAESTNLTFGDIISSLEVIKDIDISRMDSIIGAYNLTKDKEKLMMLYDYKIKTNELEKVKKEDESKVVADTLSKYKKDQSVLYLSSMTEGESSKLEQKDVDVFYNNLAQRSTDAGVVAANAQHDIEYYAKEIERLNEDVIPTSQKYYAEEEVNNLIELITQKIDTWINISEETVLEYYKINILNNSIRKISNTKVENNLFSNMKFTVAGGILIGLIIGVIIKRRKKVIQ